MRYHIEKEMTTFGKQGDVIIEASNFYYFPKEKTIKTIDHLVHNFKLKEEKLFKVSPGDVIECNDFKLTICDGNAIELEGDFDSTLLQTSTIETSYPDYPEYTNSPRIKKEANTDKVDLERIPEKDKDTSTSSLVKKLLPAMVGIVMAILMLWVRPRGIRGILMLITTLVSFGISMFTLYTERRDGRAHNKLRKETYDNYLLTKRQELAALKLEERTSSNYNYLTLNDILVELDSHSSRLYERDILDDDFLKLRLGTQTTEPSYSITNPFEKLELRYEEADDNLKALYEEYKEITNMPLVTSAKHNIGLVGNRYVISKQMKNILMQSIFNHSPLDLQIIVITDDAYLDDYQYAFSMAHFKDSEKVHNYFVHNSITRDQYLNGFTQVLRQRDMEYKQGMVFDKHLLFIIDNPALINNHPIREFLEKPEERLGMSQIQVAKASNELPKHIKTTIDYKTETRAQLILEEGKLVNKEFTLPSVDTDKAELELYYRRLSNLEHIKGIKSAVPDKLGFLEMYEVNDPKELQIASRWNKNKTYKSLAALLGKKSETDYIYLDLHEKIHGPHGLVAGTTGSGKSEVIQTYILSLAIEYSPEQVGFLLIDYKGGGMANLFKDMPHHLGSITNLDGYQSMRALASIKSELKRRQQIFSDNNVNHINNYTKLYESGQVQEPLPHLFLISDEFAELKAEQPDFMKELVSAARIGRSLGIHLILATQKPDGVVDDQIWSNSKFKLSLKVAEEADSKALLKTPDAAYITNPGRGYLKVGTNELYELFQSGYSGAPYSTNNTTSAKPEIYELDIYGNQTIINPEECTTEQEQEGIAATELDVVLEEIDNTYNTSNLTQVSKPWLPPLENYSYRPIMILDESNQTRLEVNLGTIDLPNKQAQMDYLVNFEEDGHMVTFAGSGMGKTFTLISTVLRLAAQNSPKFMKTFVFDLGNGGLLNLRDLKHTSEYFTLDFDEKQKQFCDYISKEIVRRKQTFMDGRVSSYKMYNQAGNVKMQSIFVVIDSYENLSALDEDVVKTIKVLIKDGANIGIYVLLSTMSPGDIKQNEMLSFRNVLLLHTANSQDVGTVLKKTSLPEQEIPGRGRILLDDVEVVQIDMPIKHADAIEQAEMLESLVNKINESYQVNNEHFALMPASLPYLDRSVENNKLYIGRSYSNLQDKTIELNSIYLNGMNKSGKTNFLKLIIEQIKGTCKISILDDTSYSLLEYSETEGIEYLTNPDDISVDSDIVIINKLSRFDKLKAKDLAPILEKLFLMHLKGTKFIVEGDAKGVKAGKVDIWNAVVSAPVYMYFGNPITQTRLKVDKKKYKKEDYFVSDVYLINDVEIEKLKLPLVITGNEDKEFIIPELKALESEAKPDIIDAIVVGDKTINYVSSVIKNNEMTKFKVLGDISKFENGNVEQLETIDADQFTIEDVLIVNELDTIANMDNKQKRALLAELDKLESKVIIMQSTPYKLQGEKLRALKKRFIITSDPLTEHVTQLCRNVPTSAQKIVITNNSAIKLLPKDIGKIKY